MSLESDALLAVTGMRPKAITDKDLAAAAKLPERFAKRVRAWVTGERRPFEPAEVPDLDEWFGAIAADPAESTTAAWLEAIGPENAELGPDYYVGIMHAREYVEERWPKADRPTQRGPRPVGLSPSDAAAWWDVVRVVEDPAAVLDGLEQGTLSVAQAEAFREVYPELYTAVQEAIDAAMTAQPLEWEPSPDVDELLSTLTGLPVATGATPPPPPAPPPKAGGIDLKARAAEERTKGELAADPGAAA